MRKRSLLSFDDRQKILDTVNQLLDHDKEIAAEVQRLSGYRDLLIAKAKLLLADYEGSVTYDDFLDAGDAADLMLRP